MGGSPQIRESSGSVVAAIATSIGLTIAGVAVWVMMAYMLGLFWVPWLHFLAVGVAALAGYGLTLFSDRRGAEMGAPAIVIGLAGIVLAKFIIGQWVVMPRVDEFWQNESPFAQTEVSEREVDQALNNPDSFFVFACYDLAEEFG